MTNWQPISTAPTEEGVLHVRGLWLFDPLDLDGNPTYFEARAGYLKDGYFLATDGVDHGWWPEEYTHWRPLPAAPEEK